MNLRRVSALTVAVATALTLLGCAPVYERGVIVDKQWYYLKPNVKHCFFIEDPETKRKGECLKVSKKVYDSYEKGDFYPREEG